MKVCEHCGGAGWICRATWLKYESGTKHPEGWEPPKCLCSICHGTGYISLGLEARERYIGLRRRAIERAIAQGSLWKLRDAGPWTAVTAADLEAFDEALKKASQGFVG
jgi:hypothetical protein